MISGSAPAGRRPRFASGHPRRAVALFLVLALAAGLRLFHLSADPPESLSSSRSIFNDGGTYALNARHRLLTGAWISPGDNVLAQTPGFTAISYMAFRAFGLGLISVRLLSVFGAMLAILLVTTICWREWGWRAALLAALLLGTDYLFVMYGRLELIEGLLSGVTTAAAAAAFQAGGDSKHGAAENPGAGSPAARPTGHGKSIAWAALSAILLFVSFLIKPTGAVLFPPIVLFLLWQPAHRLAPERRRARTTAAGWIRSRLPLWVFLMVLAISCLLYRELFVLPHQALFDQFREAFRLNAATLWDLRPLVLSRQALTVPGIWGARGVPLICLAAAGVAASLQDRDRWGVLLSFWLITGLVYLAPQSYRPPRFTILFVPAAAALAARGAQWLWNGGAGRPLNPVAAAGWLIYVDAASLVIPHYPPQQDLPKIEGLMALAVILLIGSFAAWKWVSIPAPVSRWIAPVLLGAILIFGDWLPYARWAAQPRYTLIRSGRRLSRLVHGRAFAGDNWAPTLGLMTRAPLYKIDWIPVPPAQLRAWGVRYLVYDGHEAQVPRTYGNLIRSGHLVTTYRVGHYPIRIVAINP